MAGVNIEEMSQYTDSSSFDRIDANTFASTSASTTTTTTGKKEEGGAKKTKVLSYPLSRRDDQETDYLEIVIAEYVPPGLQLQGVSFSKLSDNNPLLYGSLAILLAIVLGVLGAGIRQLLSKYKYIFVIKKN